MENFEVCLVIQSNQAVFNFCNLMLLLLLSRFSMSDSVRPIDGSPPGSPVPGILQARTLEWVAISFSNAWKWNVKLKSLSRVRLFATPWNAAYQAPPSMGVSRQEYWSGVPLPSPCNLIFTCNYKLHITFLLCKRLDQVSKRHDFSAICWWNVVWRHLLGARHWARGPRERGKGQITDYMFKNGGESTNETVRDSNMERYLILKNYC